MSEATYQHGPGELQRDESSAVSAGQVTQLPDGRAAVKEGLKDSIAGEPVNWRTEGVFDFEKTSSEVIDHGDRVMWDSSANKATMEHTGLGDFYIGMCVKDSASSDTTVRVEINVIPAYAIDLAGERAGIEWTEEATDGEGVSALPGGGVKLSFDAVAEVAQAAFYPANETVPVDDKGVYEFLINVADNGDDAALDINVGIANESHATDADTIGESVFFHIDGNSVNVNAESDDGTTENAAADTTVDLTTGTPLWLKIDARDKSDIKLYIDGARVLSGTTFTLDDATGPVFPILHMEKTSNDTTADLRSYQIRARKQAA